MEKHRRSGLDVNGIFWGTLILLVGITWLAVNLGYLSPAVWETLWPLWPVLLIVWGLNIIVRRTALQFLAYLSPLVLILAFGYAAVTTPDKGEGEGWAWTRAIHIGRPEPGKLGELEEYAYNFEPTDQVQEIKLDLDIGASVVNVSEASEDGFVSVKVDSNVGAPEVSFDLSDGIAKVRGQSPNVKWLSGNARQEWSIELPAAVPLAVDLNTGATDCHLDLRKMLLRELNIDTGASKIDAILPPPDETGYLVDFDGEAASLALRFPQNAPVVIDSTTTLSSVNFRREGFRKENGRWYSGSYQQGSPHARVKIDTGVSHIEIVFDQSD